MPISRPVLVALIAAILAAVAFFATQGGRQQTAGDEPAKAEAAKPARPAQADSKPTRAAGGKPSARSAGVPVKVAAAIGDRRTVLLFFRQAGGADDAATARAVAGQRGRKGVAVFSADIEDLDRYRAIVGGLGVSQAPAVVILGQGGKARLIEGFLDPETLAQEVSDAR